MHAYSTLQHMVFLRRHECSVHAVHMYVCICVHMFLTPPFPTATVFLEYLQGCDTAEEIQGMIMTLFEEEASKAREFAGKFIEKRQKMIDVSTAHTICTWVLCTVYYIIILCTHIRICVYQLFVLYYILSILPNATGS